jgi:hypothetical protein
MTTTRSKREKTWPARNIETNGASLKAAGDEPGPWRWEPSAAVKKPLRLLLTDILTARTAAAEAPAGHQRGQSSGTSRARARE